MFKYSIAHNIRMTSFRCRKCGYQFRSEAIPNYKPDKGCPKCKCRIVIKISSVIQKEYRRGNLASQKQFESETHD